MSWHKSVPEVRVCAEVAQHLVDYFMGDAQTYRGQSYEQFIYTSEHNLKRGQFEAEWSLGGTSCGYGGNTYTVSAEVETPMDDLDEFLIEKYPTIGFLQYKMIERKIARTTDDKGDYYGGTVSYGRKTLTYSDLSDTLVKYKLASDEGAVVTDLVTFMKEKYSKEWFAGVQDKLDAEHREMLGIEQARRLNKAMKKPKVQTKMNLPQKGKGTEKGLEDNVEVGQEATTRKPKMK